MTAWGHRRHGACSGVPRLRGIDVRTGQAVASRLRHELLGSGVKGQAGRPPFQEVGVIHPGTWDQWRTGLPGHIALRLACPPIAASQPAKTRRTRTASQPNRLSENTKPLVGPPRRGRSPVSPPPATEAMHAPIPSSSPGHRWLPGPAAPTPLRSLATSRGSPMRPSTAAR